MGRNFVFGCVLIFCFVLHCHTATAVAVFIIRMYSQPLVLNHYFMVRSRSYISDDTETK